MRLALTVDGAERVLIDQPSRPDAWSNTRRSRSRSIRRRLSSSLEYRNQGAPGDAVASVRHRPGAKQAVPTTNLYPADGLSSFAPVEQSYRRLHKAALILTGFGVTDAQLEWLTGNPPFLNLDALPMAPGADADGVALFRRWRQLAALYALRKKLPRSNADLFDVFRATTMAEAIDRLVLATGWDRGVVDGVPRRRTVSPSTSSAALRPPVEPADEPCSCGWRAPWTCSAASASRPARCTPGRARRPTPTAPRRSCRR